MTLAERFWSAIHTLAPEATGSMALTTDKHGEVRVTGRLSCAGAPVEALIRQALRIAGVQTEAVVMVASDALEVVASEDGVTATYPSRSPSGSPLVIYQGTLPTTAISSRKAFKHVNPESTRKIANCLAELGAFAPLVLDAQLQVIDGELRLQVARRLGIHEIPVIVLGVSAAQADFLRLVLNRSAEFQVWRHDEVGELVDSMPNLQPLLEPLGFFGTRLLPVSYFSKNLIDYAIDADNVAQQRYSQEVGLEEWARLQRERILEAERQSEAKPWTTDPTAPKLFDLPEPQDEDFVATYDPQQEIDSFVAEAKEWAFDASRRNDERWAER